MEEKAAFEDKPAKEGDDGGQEEGHPAPGRQTERLLFLATIDGTAEDYEAIGLGHRNVSNGCYSGAKWWSAKVYGADVRHMVRQRLPKVYTFLVRVFDPI